MYPQTSNIPAYRVNAPPGKADEAKYNKQYDYLDQHGTTFVLSVIKKLCSIIYDRHQRDNLDGKTQPLLLFEELARIFCNGLQLAKYCTILISALHRLLFEQKLQPCSQKAGSFLTLLRNIPLVA